MTSSDALTAAAREHWAPLLRQLTAYSGRIDLAEDALATAYARAAIAWPDQMPVNPAGWLYRTAQNALVDELRREQTAARHRHLVAHREEATAPASEVDERLELLWLACHPALAPEVRPVLALRFVLGLPTASIAALFLVSESTLAARLTRAKRRVAAAGFALADAPRDAPGRAEDVAQALHLAYTAAYLAPDDEAADDIVRLIAHVAGLVEHPALEALTVLTALTHARRTARTSAAGTLLTLAEQDRSHWQHREITAALRRYARIEPQDGYAEELRLLASIAALHSVAPTSAATWWPAIDAAYAALESLTGSPVTMLNRQAARATAGSAVDPAALAQVTDALPGHHRVHVLAAHLHQHAGDTELAAAALRSAIDACTNPRERATLNSRLTALSRS